MVRSSLPLIRSNEKHLGSPSAGFNQLINGGYLIFIYPISVWLSLSFDFGPVLLFNSSHLIDSAMLPFWSGRPKRKTIKASAARVQPSHMYFYSLPTGQNIWLSNGSRISCIDLGNVNGAIDTELGSYICITAAHLFNLEMFFPWVNKRPLMRRH